MFKSFLDYYNDKAKNGINFFFANDPTEKKPSSTLFYSYMAFWLSFISLVVLHFRADPVTASGMSIGFTGLMIVFYMIRKINKAGFNLKDKSVNLENSEGDQK
jgi:hypothetical protein